MHRTDRLWLALDQGGHASRALVFAADSTLVASAEQAIATSRPHAHWVEHKPGELLDSLHRVCARVLHHPRVRGRDITAAGLATQRSTVVCWDRFTGEALSPVISWQDRRAARHLQSLLPQADVIREITGLVPSPHYGASKIAWCLANFKPVRQALGKERLAAGPLASFILANLLVERPLLADPVNAARTLLWDYRNHAWSPALLGLFGIPVSILPRTLPNRYAFGHIRAGKREIPLRVVTGDQNAALFAAGEPAENAAYVNMGTGAFLLRVCGRHPVSVPRLLAEILWQDEKRTLYAVEGTVNGAGSALDAVGQQLHVSGQRLLTQMPRWLDESHDPPVFLNGISGLGSPFWLPRFRSRFIGRAGAAEKLVAVAESILFLLCTNLERMQTGNGGIRRLVVSGGLAQWDGLCRRLASLSGLPVHRPAQHEATATGLAWLLGAGVNKADEGLIYPPAAVPGLEQRYARWRAAMRTALAGSFQGF